MDYDTAALQPATPRAGYRPEVLQQWLAIIAAHAPVDRKLIDVDCGTGACHSPCPSGFRQG